MSDQSIISRVTIRDRARRAFFANQERDSHNMNPGAAALTDWLAEYDRLSAERLHDIALESRRAIRAAKGSPQCQFPAAEFKRVDARQGQA